tara:strand:- start:387 stop:572 length:186 start_codon:yes stop_codon:yes gene_type:complete
MTEELMEIVIPEKLLEYCEGCGGKLLLITGHPHTDSICINCCDVWLKENKHRFVNKGDEEE